MNNNNLCQDYDQNMFKQQNLISITVVENMPIHPNSGTQDQNTQVFR